MDGELDYIDSATATTCLTKCNSLMMPESISLSGRHANDGRGTCTFNSHQSGRLVEARHLVYRKPGSSFFQNTFSRAQMLGLFSWIPPDSRLQSFIVTWELAAQGGLQL